MKTLSRRPLRGLALFLALTLGLVAGSGAATSPPAGLITLNFVNADMGAVIKAMSEMTGRTFVVDPRVKGTLNISSPQPVSPAVAYDILLASLRMQGYAAVQVDNVVRIIPEAEAKFYAVAKTRKSSRSRVGGEVATRVFSLRHESAMQLQSVLRPLVGANGTISAEPSSNTLIVTDYSDSLERLEQVINGIDVPSDDEPVVIPLRYVSAQNISDLVSRVFAPAGGASANAPQDALQVGMDDRSNSLILRCRNRSLIGKVQTLAATLDVPTPVAGNVHVIYLKNAQAVDMAKTLRNIVKSDTSPLVQPGGQAPASAQSVSMPVSQESGPGMIQADAATNALIITAPEAIFNNLKAVVDKLDVRRPQVLIEALIAEVSADKAAEFGIQWMHVGSNGSVAGFGNSGSNNIGVLASDPVGAIAGATQGLNLGVGGGLKTLIPATTSTDSSGVTSVVTPAVQIYSLGLLATALETDAGANILSTPSVLTLDNQEAKISVGSNVPFQTGSYAISSGSSASPFTTIERRDVGLILKVKPQISEGGMVRLDVSEEVSSIQGAGGVLAATNKRSLETSVLADDGQIIVLGGLLETQVQDTEDKVPLLGDIPLLGHLFRYSSRTHAKTNLMIFLRPKIIRDAATAAAETNVRYDYVIGRQKASTPPHKPMLPDVPVTTLPERPNYGAASPVAAETGVQQPPGEFWWGPAASQGGQDTQTTPR